MPKYKLLAVALLCFAMSAILFMLALNLTKLPLKTEAHWYGFIVSFAVFLVGAVHLFLAVGGELAARAAKYLELPGHKD